MDSVSNVSGRSSQDERALAAMEPAVEEGGRCHAKVGFLLQPCDAVHVYMARRHERRSDEGVREKGQSHIETAQAADRGRVRSWFSTERRLFWGHRCLAGICRRKRSQKAHVGFLYKVGVPQQETLLRLRLPCCVFPWGRQVS